MRLRLVYPLPLVSLYQGYRMYGRNLISKVIARPSPVHPIPFLWYRYVLRLRKPCRVSYLMHIRPHKFLLFARLRI